MSIKGQVLENRKNLIIGIVAAMIIVVNSWVSMYLLMK